MNVMVIGSGAREHALVWKLLQSPRVKDVYVAPGNAGTGIIAHNLPVPADDIAGLKRESIAHQVELTVVGPEVPLAEGVVDEFQSSRLRIFGPTQAAARIESSKAFAKDLMKRHGIPCADGQAFTDINAARDYLYRTGTPTVIKADGLAGGKGVVICQTIEEADYALDDAMTRMAFGVAGRQVVIEEYLEGPEVSVLGFSDGETVRVMESASDYKRALDSDLGPNTGGMGCVSPSPVSWPDLSRSAEQSVLTPAIQALKMNGCPFVGVLYAGLMLTDRGLRVLEFNCRLGDPEAQVVLPRLKTDLLDVMEACVDGRLSGVELEWDARPCVGVVMASGGYPERYQTGFPITGLDTMDDGVRVFHAGTASRPIQANSGLRRLWATDLPSPGVDALLSGDVVTDGGRVLTVVALGDTVEESRNRAYANVARIRFQDAQYRTDIGAHGSIPPIPEPRTADVVQGVLPPHA